MVDIEIAPAGKRLVVRWREDGRVTSQQRFDQYSTGQQKTVARKCGIDVPTLISWCEQVAAADKAVVFNAVAPPVQTVDFIVREIEQTAEQGESIDINPERMLSDRLPFIEKSQVLTWSDTERLCCLDVDYHEGTIPDRAQLESIVLTRIAPRPFCWHFSRGGGLHLFYLSVENLTAEELAAVAALRFRMIDPTAGVELKHVVRGPGGETVTFAGERDSSGLMLDWLKEPQTSTFEQDEYLEAHNLEIGRRYPHEQCPVAPSPDEGKHRDPVVVKDAGVTCYICEANGRVFGSRRPGWFPWSALLGHPTAGDVGAMVRHLCHWGHAKWLFAEKYGLKEDLAKLAYRAALKTWHAGKDSEVLVDGVFRWETDRYARVGTDWMDIEGSVELSKNIGATLSKLPWTETVDEKGEIKSMPARVTNLLEAIDWRDEGYPPIKLIYGIKMAPDLAPTRDTLVAVPSPELKAAGGERVLPRYVPFSKRMKIDKARSVIEQVAPGVNWNLIDLILCGIGSTQETGLGSPPRIFVTGPSESAKSSHFMIAGGIAGVTVGEPSMQGSDERLRQAIMAALGNGPILVINEIFKDSVRNSRKLSPTQALEPILTLEKNSMTHVLYKGARKFGRQFVLGMTEIVLPPDIRAETQLARRIRYVPLSHSHPEWRALAATAKLREFTDLRLLGSELIAACNSILSDCMDRFFTLPMSFDEQAELLGVQTLRDSVEFEDPKRMLRHFYKLVCLAPDITNQRLKKLYPGFKQISRNDPDGGDAADELFTVYSGFADGSGNDWTKARKLEEKDWGMTLGVPESVKFVLRTNGSSVFVRFQVGPVYEPVKINKQIVDPTDWTTI